MHILVVDDQADMADTLAEFLRGSGHSVDVGYGSRQALQQALEHSPEVAFIDIVMPDTNGWGLAKQLRERALGTYLVAITGSAADERRAHSQEAGFDMHLVKPVEPARLELVLARAEQVVATRRTNVSA